MVSTTPEIYLWWENYKIWKNWKTGKSGKSGKTGKSGKSSPWLSITRKVVDWPTAP